MLEGQQTKKFKYDKELYLNNEVLGIAPQIFEDCDNDKKIQITLCCCSGAGSATIESEEEIKL